MTTGSKSDKTYRVKSIKLIFIGAFLSFKNNYSCLRYLLCGIIIHCQSGILPRIRSVRHHHSALTFVSVTLLNGSAQVASLADCFTSIYQGHARLHKLPNRHVQAPALRIGLYQHTGAAPICTSCLMSTCKWPLLWLNLFQQLWSKSSGVISLRLHRIAQWTGAQVAVTAVG